MNERRVPLRKIVRKRPLHSRVANFAKSYESILILISVSISSVTAIAAMIALYLTSRQVALVEEERSTPYKVALYNQKLDGIRQSLDAIASFQYRAICHLSIRKYEPNQIYGNPNFMNSLRDCDKTLKSSAIQLDRDLKRNLLFWPKKYRIHILEYLVKSGDFQMCGYMQPMKDAINIPNEIKIQYKSRCSDDVEKKFEKLQNLEISIIGYASEVMEGNY